MRSSFRLSALRPRRIVRGALLFVGLFAVIALALVGAVIAIGVLAIGAVVAGVMSMVRGQPTVTVQRSGDTTVIEGEYRVVAGASRPGKPLTQTG
jgi:uncharacterized protein (DUF58 family)